MNQSASVISPADPMAIPVPDTSHSLVTRGPPGSGGPASAGNGAPGPAEVARYLTEDRDRMAQDLNDAVIHRLFAAGLDLQAALGLVGDHKVAARIHHAIGELDRAIRDFRGTLFRSRPAAAATRPGDQP